MKHLPEDIEGVKLPGLQDVLYLLTTTFLIRRVKSRVHICSPMCGYSDIINVI